MTRERAGRSQESRSARGDPHPNLHKGFVVGHAPSDADRGWFVGQFAPESAGIRRQDGVELKWGVHKAREARRGGWCFNRLARTVAVLIEGDFVLRFLSDGVVHTVRLRARGDYVIFSERVPHHWRAIKHSVVLTIRFPSVPDDQVTVPAPTKRLSYKQAYATPMRRPERRRH